MERADCTGKPVLEALRSLLVEHGVGFRELTHEPTPTSEDAARVRGDPLAQGGKALVVKTGDLFRLFVMSAVRRLDSSALKRRFRVKRVRFATADELMGLTGLVPGSVPPFGRPLLPFDLFVDPSVTAREAVSFNAGSLTCSMTLAVEDYVRVARPEILAFTK